MKVWCRRGVTEGFLLPQDSGSQRILFPGCSCQQPGAGSREVMFGLSVSISVACSPGAPSTARASVRTAGTPFGMWGWWRG